MRSRLIAAPAAEAAGRGRHDLRLDVGGVAGDPYPGHGGRAGRIRLDPGSQHVLAEPHLGRLQAERDEQFGAGRHARRDNDSVECHATAVGQPDTGQAAGVRFDLLDLALSDGDSAGVKLRALLAGLARDRCAAAVSRAG